MSSLNALISSSEQMLPLLITLLAYEGGIRLQRLCRGHPAANPVLIAVVAVAATLSWLGIPESEYMHGVGPLTFLLAPATIALAVPLYRHMPRIREAFLPTLATVAVGATVATVTALTLASLCGLTGVILHSIATKTNTAAIAMAVAPQLGGDASLAAGVSVLTGILGGIVCTWVLDRAGVRDPRARGLATGITAHGIGTARLLALDTEAGAFSGLAMGLTGLAGGFLLPLVYAAFWG